MADYHVGSGLAAIYAGRLKKNDKTQWAQKSDVTDEAIRAVRDYMVDDCLGGTNCPRATSSGYEWILKDGRTVELRITIKPKKDSQEATND